jgi:hypothetical protein
MANHDGRKGCALMNPTLEAAIAEDYGQPPGPLYARGKTCRVVLTKIFNHTYPGRPADAVASRITGFLLFANEGYVYVRSRVNPHGEITVSRSHPGGRWRIGSLIGREAKQH